MPFWTVGVGGPLVWTAPNEILVKPIATTGVCSLRSRPVRIAEKCWKVGFRSRSWLASEIGGFFPSGLRNARRWFRFNLRGGRKKGGAPRRSGKFVLREIKFEPSFTRHHSWAECSRFRRSSSGSLIERKHLNFPVASFIAPKPTASYF